MLRSIRVPAPKSGGRKTYLDSSALSELWRSTRLPPDSLKEVRARLSSLDFPERPVLVLSQWLYREMSARIENARVAELVDTQLAFIDRLPSFLFLQEHSHVLRSEVAAVLRGEMLDIFFPEGSMLPVGSEQIWRQELEHRNSDRAIFTRIREAEQQRFRSQFPVPRGELVRKLRAEVLPGLRLLTNSWVLDDMELAAADLGLPDDPHSWPLPDELPTLWARGAFAVAHAYKIDHDGSSIDPNDFHDWAHYASAAHADDFVTADRRLFSVAELCVPPKPAILTFEDWAHRILAT